MVTFGFKKRKALAQIPVLLGLLIMALVVPAATKLVQENQDTRNKAAGCRPLGNPCDLNNPCCSPNTCSGSFGGTCKAPTTATKVPTRPPTAVPTRAPTPTPINCPNGACTLEGSFKCRSNNQYRCDGECWNMMKNCPNGCLEATCAPLPTLTPTRLPPTSTPTLTIKPTPTLTPKPISYTCMSLGGSCVSYGCTCGTISSGTCQGEDECCRPCPTSTPKPTATLTPTKRPTSTPTKAPSPTPTTACTGTCQYSDCLTMNMKTGVGFCPPPQYCCGEKIIAPKCNIGDKYCATDNSGVWVCKTDRSGYTLINCSSGKKCDSVTEKCVSISTPTPTKRPTSTPTRAPSPTPTTACSGTCQYSDCSIMGMKTATGKCPGPQYCCGEKIISFACNIGERTCLSDKSGVNICKPDRTGYTVFKCSEGRTCDETSKTCVALPTVTPTRAPTAIPTTACTGTCQYSDCLTMNMKTATGKCPGPQYCCGEKIISFACNIGERTCLSDKSGVNICKPDRTGYTVFKCSEGRTCDETSKTCVALPTATPITSCLADGRTTDSASKCCSKNAIYAGSSLICSCQADGKVTDSASKCCSKEATYQGSSLVCKTKPTCLPENSRYEEGKCCPGLVKATSSYGYYCGKKGNCTEGTKCEKEGETFFQSRCNISTGYYEDKKRCDFGCEGNVCRKGECPAGTSICLDDKTLQTCTSDGTGWTKKSCTLCSNGKCFEGALKKSGEECLSNEQCASGYCDGYRTGSMFGAYDKKGTCLNYDLKLGEVCKSSSQCLSGSCQQVGGQNKCAVKKSGGLSCLANEDCESEKCLSAVKKCSPLPLGEKCKKNEECSSEYCSGDVCTVRKKTGESCSKDAECITGVCMSSSVFGSNKTCVEKKKGGEKCSGDTNCESGRCTGGKCEPFSIGSACTRDLQCESQYCPSGEFFYSTKYCASKKSEGGECRDNGECESGNCQAGGVWGKKICSAKKEGGGECSKDANCISGTCTSLKKCAPLANGATCSKDTDCESGSCFDDGRGKKCGSKAEGGAACKTDANCLSGKCVITSGSTKCAPLNKGDKCKQNDDCESKICDKDSKICGVIDKTHICTPGETKCNAKRTILETCNETADKWTPKACPGCRDDGLCIPRLKNNGESCTMSEECASGICEDSKQATIHNLSDSIISNYGGSSSGGRNSDYGRQCISATLNQEHKETAESLEKAYKDFIKITGTGLMIGLQFTPVGPAIMIISAANFGVQSYITCSNYLANKADPLIPHELKIQMEKECGIKVANFATSALNVGGRITSIAGFAAISNQLQLGADVIDLIMSSENVQFTCTKHGSNSDQCTQAWLQAGISVGAFGMDIGQQVNLNKIKPLQENALKNSQLYNLAKNGDTIAYEKLPYNLQQKVYSDYLNNYTKVSALDNLLPELKITVDSRIKVEDLPRASLDIKVEDTPIYRNHLIDISGVPGVPGNTKIDPQDLAIYLNGITDPARREAIELLANKVMANHISHDEFINALYNKTVPSVNNIIGNDQYLSIVEQNKSNKWVLQLSMPNLSHPPVVVFNQSINSAEVSAAVFYLERNPSVRSVVMFDDASHSGLQLTEYSNELRMAAEARGINDLKIIIAAPYTTKFAESRLLNNPAVTIAEHNIIPTANEIFTQEELDILNAIIGGGYNSRTVTTFDHKVADSVSTLDLYKYLKSGGGFIPDPIIPYKRSFY